jgi:hypothetical protein
VNITMSDFMGLSAVKDTSNPTDAAVSKSALLGSIYVQNRLCKVWLVTGLLRVPGIFSVSGRKSLNV